MFDIRKIQEQVLFGAVSAEGSEAAAEAVVGADRHEPNAEWVNAAMDRLEARFDEGSVKRIRMSCQCGYGMDEKLALVKELKAGASSLEEFANSEKAKAAGLFCEGGELYLQFFFCPCPMLAEVQKLRSKTWCQCTAGYSKALFEKAFGCEFDVELLKSIKAGDDICLMKLLPKAKLWG